MLKTNTGFISDDWDFPVCYPNGKFDQKEACLNTQLVRSGWLSGRTLAVSGASRLITGLLLPWVCWSGSRTEPGGLTQMGTFLLVGEALRGGSDIYWRCFEAEKKGPYGAGDAGCCSKSAIPRKLYQQAVE